MGTSATPDGTTTFSWPVLSSGTRNLQAYSQGSFVNFRLDSSNDRVVGATTFNEPSDLNPIWVFANKAPVAIGGADALQAEVNKMTKGTNDYRAQYGANPLTYSTTGMLGRPGSPASWIPLALRSFHTKSPSEDSTGTSPASTVRFCSPALRL